MIRVVLFCLTFGVTCFTGPPVLAFEEKIETTISTEIVPVFQNGELTGCALNFQAGRNDYTYFGGDLALINGSLNLYSAKGKAPFYVLKLGVMRNGEKDYVAPSTAFILSDKSSNKVDLRTSIDAESPGFRMFTFSVGEASLKVMEDTTKANNTIRIGYTMNGGSMSSIIPITLTMKKLNFANPSESVVDERGTVKWWECNLNALEASSELVEPSK
jgi:hypothetical protein